MSIDKQTEILTNSFSESGSLKTITLQEEFFFLGQAFSFEDRFTLDTGGTLFIQVDPTAFEPLGVGVETRIPFNPVVTNAVAGPILIDFYTGTSSNDDGTVLGASNRDSTATKMVPDLVLQTDPTGLNKGTRFAGDLNSATASGPGGNVLAAGVNTPSLPFAISNLNKYGIEFTNLNGDEVIFEVKLTWFEILE